MMKNNNIWMITLWAGTLFFSGVIAGFFCQSPGVAPAAVAQPFRPAARPAVSGKAERDDQQPHDGPA